MTIGTPEKCCQGNEYERPQAEYERERLGRVVEWNAKICDVVRGMLSKAEMESVDGKAPEELISLMDAVKWNYTKAAKEFFRLDQTIATFHFERGGMKHDD